MEPKPTFLNAEYARQFEDSSVAAVYRKRPPYPPETFSMIADLFPTANRHLLDLGAGTGEISIPMAEKADSVHAVEPSTAMIQVGRSIPNGDNPKISWFNTSGESFAYPRTYGLIVCAQCLGWMDWDVVFPRMRSSLDPAGYLVIVNQIELSEPIWTSELKSIVSRFSTNRDYVPFDLVEEIIERGLFRKAGSRQSPSLRFEQSIEDFIDSIHARNGFSRDRMDLNAADEFDGTVRRLLERHHPDCAVSLDIAACVTWGMLA